MRTDVGPVGSVESIDRSSVQVYSIRAAGPTLCHPQESGFGLMALVAKAVAAFTGFCVDAPAHFDVVNIRTGEYARIEPFPDGTLADRFARELGSDWRAFRREDHR
jgi:hypothetical protein